MERFNPFSADSSNAHEYPSLGGSSDDSSPERPSTVPERGRQVASRSDSTGSGRLVSQPPPTPPRNLPPTSSLTSSTTPPIPQNRYSTNFPDFFSDMGTDNKSDSDSNSVASQNPSSQKRISRTSTGSQSIGSNRSNSVTFSPNLRTSDDPISSPTRAQRQTSGASGLTSFLSRATSVTSGSMITDRVSGAVGSVRSAVDSISNQIQQAVPSNLNERLFSTASNLVGSADGGQQFAANQQATSQSAASYLASKISSVGQFASSAQNSSSLPVISRQRLILILDSSVGADWVHEFGNYRRLTSGLSPQFGLSSLFTSATAQLGASSPLLNTGSVSSAATEVGAKGGGANLICQADFRDISVLANQSTSTATILITGANCNTSNLINISSSTSNGTSSTNISNSRLAARIIRPEYVVVRQRTKDNLEHLRGIVTALNYCLVPIFEPMEIWNIFQDRQLIFAKLLRIQNKLGKENFPLIPQIYCQTHQDLLNYINNSSVLLPCLLKTGPLGKGKIKINNLQMLKDFASIMATSRQSCTIEQYLDVKCDLVVQKLGTSLKLFKRNTSLSGPINSESSFDDRYNISMINDSTRSHDLHHHHHHHYHHQQPAARQSSIGSSVLSSLINAGSGSQNQQLIRQASNPAAQLFERQAEVSIKYMNWIEAIGCEFDNKLDAFCIKIVVANNDREYIVGLSDCSMDFLGNADNQEEDRRSFVELIISNMNTNLPKIDASSNVSADAGAAAATTESISAGGDAIRSCSRDYNDKYVSTQNNQRVMSLPLGDKKKFTSQTQINDDQTLDRDGNPTCRAYGQLSSRSQSVSVNQSDYFANQRQQVGGMIGGGNQSSYLLRRSSERSDSGANEIDNSLASYGSRDSGSQLMNSSSGSSGLHQRQASFGQSFFDQTSTAFSSFQKNSLNFFKKLDSRVGDQVLVSSTPPQSAKSDKGFDRSFLAGSSADPRSAADRAGNGKSAGRNGFKSQSIDSSALDGGGLAGCKSPRRRETPPKPPPPMMSARQSSLASYNRPPSSSNVTPTSTPLQTRQNSSISEVNDVGISRASSAAAATNGDQSRRGKVVRQNSALSAFEPFDADLGKDITAHRMASKSDLAADSASIGDSTLNRSLDPTKRSTNLDSASITSGDSSNSTGETGTAEDTMNNLKKTFASIFGDKCE